jgi:hypothetical protein
VFKDWSRRRKLGKVKPGDGTPLKAYRWWQPLSRTIFYFRSDLAERSDLSDLSDAGDWTDVSDPGDANDASDRIAIADGEAHVYAVDVDFFDWNSEARLYRDGRQFSRSVLPAAFPVPGGVIEVATSTFGLTRMHFVAENGEERVLLPGRGTAEGLRARFGRRFPRWSRGVGALAIIILLVGLVVAAPQALEVLTHIDWVAENFGVFESPLVLPVWANTVLLVAGAIAALERALTLRSHWLIDLDTWWLG